MLVQIRLAVTLTLHRRFGASLAILLCAHSTLAQTTPDVRTVDLCKDRHTLAQAPATYITSNEMNGVPEVRLSAASLAAIHAATLASLDTLQGACNLYKSDTGFFTELFDKAETYPYKVMRWVPGKPLPPNIGGVLLYHTTGVPVTYLLTYRLAPRKKSCPEIIQVMVLGYGIANNHWRQNRASDLSDPNNIRIGGECWLREDEADDTGDHVVWQNVIASVQPDGTLAVRESGPVK